jgi:hypothetical protein
VTAPVVHVDERFTGDIDRAFAIADRRGPTPGHVPGGFKWQCLNPEHGLQYGATVRRHPKGVDAIEIEMSCGCDPDEFSRALAELEREIDLPVAVNQIVPIGRSLKVIPAGDVKIEPVDYVIDGRVARKAAAILAGDPGLGKSSLTFRWAADVTTGRHGGPAANVLIANGEDARSVSAARLRAAGADMARVSFFVVEDEHGERAAELPDDVPLIEVRAAEIGDVALIVIDPLNAHLADGTNAHRDHSIRRAIAPASAMAERLNCALLFVAHLNKAAGGDALYRIGGSIGLVGGVRSVLLFTADPDDPGGDEGSQRCLGHIKSNWGRKAPTAVYKHVPVELEVDGRKIETHRLDFVGESDVAGDQLLGIDPEEPPATKRERAVELLADNLAGKDWTRASEIEVLASHAGIGRRTLYKAADEVGVEREKRGFPAVGWWRLGSRAPAECTTVVQPELHDSASPVVERNPASPEGQSCKSGGNARQGHLRPVPDPDPPPRPTGSPSGPYDTIVEDER